MFSERGELKVLAVIPSLSVERLANIRRLSGAMVAEGIEVLVVANGMQLREALQDSEISWISANKNLGFGAAVNLGAAQTNAWDWLLLVNDDVEMEGQLFPRALIAWLTARPGSIIANFDDSLPKRIPDSIGIFMNLSLMSGVAKRSSALRPARSSATYAQGKYSSFSLVAISRNVWAKAGGFDERFPFTFEDSDFVRRAIRDGAQMEWPDLPGATHAHSVTGKSHIESTLPVSAWGAYLYLRKWQVGRIGATSVCVTALMVRTAVVPFVGGSTRKHLKGIARAIRAIVSQTPPPLPLFEAA